VVAVITNSIHRNTGEVIGNLAEFTDGVDIWIVGAGMANHLTGTSDAILRYKMGDMRVPVIGVAFQGKTPEQTQAAIISIQQVPGTQVIFDDYVGPVGFYRACKRAVEGNFPAIKAVQDKPVRIRTLADALKTARSLEKEAQ
jgi:phosphoribosylcarboxyaminoimidazole (NCAIR) mutase